jgi:ribosomal protein S18 acetylase RimI-like enzyme
VEIVGKTSFSSREKAAGDRASGRTPVLPDGLCRPNEGLQRDSTNDHPGLNVRLAQASDKAQLRAAVAELHNVEGSLHDSRLPGEETADAYLAWMLTEAARDGAIFVAEAGGVFAGFAAGWIVEENYIEETSDSNRFGYVSDVCVMPAFRGRRIVARLLEALEVRLSLNGIKRIRLSALAANKAARRSYERLGYAAYEIVYEKAARNLDGLSAASAQRASER